MLTKPLIYFVMNLDVITLDIVVFGYCLQLIMTKDQANLILDQVRVGIVHPLYIINLALTITGDL